MVRVAICDPRVDIPIEFAETANDVGPESRRIAMHRQGVWVIVVNRGNLILVLSVDVSAGAKGISSIVWGA
jgi:hypothetical protein